MRFLFFTGGWTVGGMETAFLSLMKGLAARGHQPTAIVSGWTDGEVPRLWTRRAFRTTKCRSADSISAMRFSPGTPCGACPRRDASFVAIAANVRPDWVISPDVQTLLLSASILRTRRALFLQSPPERLMQHRWGGRLLDRRLDRVLCCSQFIAEWARSTPVDPAKLAVVHNGVPIPAAAPIVQRTPPRLAIVGRIVDQKQHMVLLEACSLLKRRGVDCRLDIVGTKGGDFSDAVEARISALGLVRAGKLDGFLLPTATGCTAKSTSWSRRPSRSRSA